ncbi:MAG: hypothetical protein DHS20C15_04780 [Planctomycetota bacterium]|nr:MAG: hypothetical protein DHS20C15_04780 [Planctomycetota bacterium]
MTTAERQFFGCVVIATALVPGLLMLGQPLNEPRQVLGFACGWGLALLALVPSTLLMLRVKNEEGQRFYNAFMGATAFRFALILGAVAGFWFLVEQPPLIAFLMSLFLGYVILTALELILLTRRDPNGSHA